MLEKDVTYEGKYIVKNHSPELDGRIIIIDMVCVDSKTNKKEYRVRDNCLNIYWCGADNLERLKTK